MRRAPAPSDSGPPGEAVATNGRLLPVEDEPALHPVHGPERCEPRPDGEGHADYGRAKRTGHQVLAMSPPESPGPENVGLEPRPAGTRRKIDTVDSFVGS
jgi:hypothetical protein